MSVKERQDPVLVLCDREEEYAQLMTEFLQRHREVPWKVHTYTDVKELMDGEGDGQSDVLLISERTYHEDVLRLHTKRMVILRENGVLEADKYTFIDKYQQAMDVLQQLLELYLEVADITIPGGMRRGKQKLLGIYSPVRRCRQTTFALTLAQMLAENHRTLYLNFEHYVGISELCADVGGRDLADLLYFLMTDDDKFAIRFHTMVKHLGNLDYVPPMKSGQNMLFVQAKEWMKLFQRIDQLDDYEIIILDLSESMQGLFDLLRMCDKVFTLTGEDRVAQGKLAEYERLLDAYEYEDVLQKTRKCRMPKVRRIPDSLEEYTRGEVADFVKRMIRELEVDTE